MLLKELFEREGLKCPEWLSNEYLEDDWKDSSYSFEEDNHIWALKTPFKNVCITFNVEEYNFYAIIDEELICLETSTKDYVIQY